MITWRRSLRLWCMRGFSRMGGSMKGGREWRLLTWRLVLWPTNKLKYSGIRLCPKNRHQKYCLDSSASLRSLKANKNYSSQSAKSTVKWAPSTTVKHPLSTSHNPNPKSHAFRLTTTTTISKNYRNQEAWWAGVIPQRTACFTSRPTTRVSTANESEWWWRLEI